ncbi:MAG: hypothetical protein DMF61_11235 [Blastocatellia bacterium AA13]|nr:MAG: hypothetical protein DMF61_11235 [Blastocatellia bacterium AA13]
MGCGALIGFFDSLIMLPLIVCLSLSPVDSYSDSNSGFFPALLYTSILYLVLAHRGVVFSALRGRFVDWLIQTDTLERRALVMIAGGGLGSFFAALNGSGGAFIIGYQVSDFAFYTILGRDNRHVGGIAIAVKVWRLHNWTVTEVQETKAVVCRSIIPPQSC